MRNNALAFIIVAVTKWVTAAMVCVSPLIYDEAIGLIATQ
ncbi:hypothetical protein F652_2812 [Enterobacteriaceae bacterium bta3-1]|nr:hypothetical protein F652_2812 [Enterobacteriaceae bacterium bta3-1]